MKLRELFYRQSMHATAFVSTLRKRQRNLPEYFRSSLTKFRMQEQQGFFHTALADVLSGGVIEYSRLFFDSALFKHEFDIIIIITNI